MAEELRSEILLPTRPHLRNTAAVAASCGVLGASLALLAMPTPKETVTVVAMPAEHRFVALPALAPLPAPPVAPPAQDVRHGDLSLVFSAGGASYVKLADIGKEAEPMPTHGKASLHSDEDGEAAVALVQPADVPQAYRSWLGRSIVVDSTCATKVTGFAIVSRLTGDTGYAGVDDAKWTAQNVLEHGGVVLAAKLASCTGTYARAAELPPVIVPQEIDDAKLAAKARAALIESSPARDAQLEWLELDQGQNWWDSELAQFSTRIVRHPTTNVTFVSVHGSMERGCGDAEINVWGLYRVQPDGSLAAVQLRKLGDLWSIDKLIDIDNDGELELIGTPWLGLDTVVVRASGEELERLSVPFFGCPC